MEHVRQEHIRFQLTVIVMMEFALVVVIPLVVHLKHLQPALVDLACCHEYGVISLN